LRRICQRLIGDGETNHRLISLSNHLPNLLTNQGFSTSTTAGNALRPRQRMRTLRLHCRVGKRRGDKKLTFGFGLANLGYYTPLEFII
ncbi:MAG: hypothetical protein ACQEW0_17850, partial [Pseudomonadota bacterium]